ncbi:MAG: hypothetical protein H7Y07_11210 [Pyrinomonadaceae bacterium]|nr:hypothetical protein [Sphingobacteriaceae bacterium]
MKKLILSIIALTVISISSCKKEDGAKPQIKNDTNRVAAKNLTTYD